MPKPLLALLDNHDSFTWNLVQGFQTVGCEVRVFEAATATFQDFAELAPSHIVVGPGPGHPKDATLSMELFEAFPGLPMLGVCLGHQALALGAGAKITGTPELAHGQPIDVLHKGGDLFHGLDNPVPMGRYHSLTVSAEGLPSCLEVTATSRKGEVMGITHRERPHLGVQFHPESILSGGGLTLFRNFLAR
jgi:anthranilate synthase/aminodeoxychorismate synthase-like glutamine amidotransferase